MRKASKNKQRKQPFVAYGIRPIFSDIDMFFEHTRRSKQSTIEPMMIVPVTSLECLDIVAVFIGLIEPV